MNKRPTSSFLKGGSSDQKERHDQKEGRDCSGQAYTEGPTPVQSSFPFILSPKCLQPTSCILKHTHTHTLLHILFKTKACHPSSLPAVPLHPPVHRLIPRASVSSPINWDRRQLCPGHGRNKCQYPQSTRSPPEAGAHQNDNEQPPNRSPVVAESPTPQENAGRGEETNRRDIDGFPGEASPHCRCRLTLPRPQTKIGQEPLCRKRAERAYPPAQAFPCW